MTLRVTGAHRAEGPWPEFGILKTRPKAAELGNGAWGKGQNWEGSLQTQLQDLGKETLSVRTRGTEKGETLEIRRETGDMKSGQALLSGNHYHKAPWNPRAQNRQPGSKRCCRGPGQWGQLVAAAQHGGSWRRPSPLGCGSDSRSQEQRCVSSHTLLSQFANRSRVVRALPRPTQMASV